MQTEVQEIEVENTQLTKILQDSKLELSEADKIKQSYLPYFQQLATIKEEAKKINYDNPSPLDEKIARDLRLRTVKVRTGSESIKEERKRIYMLRANVEQQAWNLIKSNCQLDEEIFLQVEKKREIAEAKRKADLKVIRENEITQQGLNEFVPSVINLGELSDDEYAKLHAGAQMQLQARIEAANKAEAERIAQQKKEAEEREAQRLENIRLKEEARLREETITKEKAAQEAIRKAEQEKADALLDQQRKAAAKEKAAADAKLKAEKEARVKAESELKAKQAAEAKAEVERIAAMKKAAAAPDKIKLTTLANEILNIALPEMKTDEGEKIIHDVEALMLKLANFIREKAAQL